MYSYKCDYAKIRALPMFSSCMGLHLIVFVMHILCSAVICKQTCAIALEIKNGQKLK